MLSTAHLSVFLALVALALVSMAGCDDPVATSMENFPKSLTAFFERNWAMLPMGFGSFPAKLPDDGFGNPRPSFLAARTLAFVEAGLRAGVSGVEPINNPFGSPARTQQRIVYDLTEKGRSLFKPLGNAGPGSPPGFGAGKIPVVSVDQFTALAEAGGQQISNVSFRARADYEDWTKAPEIQAAFGEQLSHAAPATLALPMVLMNDSSAVAMGPPG